MVKLYSPIINKPIWMPPGGGVNVGESLTEAVKRECLEEVRLSVEPKELIYVHELIKNDIHVLEYYFLCELLDGVLKLGSDPERKANPLLLEAKWFPIKALSSDELVRPEFLKNELSSELFNSKAITKFFSDIQNS